MQTNTSTPAEPPEATLASFFRLLGQPVRIRILLAIGRRGVCVCHLEAVLGQRQAAISQHLMQLREAGLVVSERSGRHIYYRLSHPKWIDLIISAAVIFGETDWVDQALSLDPVPGCCCPECSPTPICPRISETDPVCENTENIST